MTGLALDNLTSFQLSTIGVGAIVTGLEDIRQCIDFILRTVKGSDPLRPTFGSDVFDYIDKPLNIAIPNIKKAIFEAIDLWEPRVKIETISHEVKDYDLLFNVTYSITDDELTDTITWSPAGIVSAVSSTPPAGIILSAVVPAKISNGRYNISFIADGERVNPIPPAIGFATASDLLNWTNANYFNYGRWYLNAARIYLYMFAGVVKTASLTISQTVNIVIKSAIPVLNDDEYYAVQLTVDSTAAVPSFPADQINTVEGLMFWVSSNWSTYGSWFIETDNAIISEGDFSEDFDNDFDIGGVEVPKRLVFQSDKYQQATLTVTK